MINWNLLNFKSVLVISIFALVAFWIYKRFAKQGE